MSELARDTGAAWLDSQADAAQGITGTLPPRPLPNSRPPVEPFRADMLPEAIRAYVMDVADRQQSPPDFVAVASICGLSAVLGRKVLIRPKQHDDWTVTPNQWGAIIGRPSAMKSPSMKEALRPLDKIQRDAREAFEFALEEHAAENRLREIEKGEIEKQAKKLAREKKREEALALLVQSEAQGEAPTRLRLVVNDASVEKLGELLNENPNGLILVRDELAGWLSKMTQDDHQADRAFYLECFDGNGRFTYDRIGRGTIDIEHCTLSMIGGIQPSKIAPLVRGATRGTADDGLIQRLQLAVWPDDNRNWRWIDRQPDSKARHAFEQAFYRLHGLHFDDGTGEPPCWRFTAKAQGLFVEWMEEVQRIARADDIHPALESHLLKMPQTIAAMAWPYGAPDRTGDVILPGAFAKSLEGYRERDSMPPMLWQHKHDEPVGYWLELEDTPAGLAARGKIEMAVAKGADAYALAKNKGLSLSIGFTAEEGDTYTEDGIRYFKQVDLLEVSLVSVPANAGATIQSVKALEELTEKEFETRVRDALGLSRRQAKRLTGLAYTAMTQRDADGMSDDAEQTIIEALKGATHRIRKTS